MPHNAPEYASEHLKSSKFPCGGCPQTPLGSITSGQPCSLHSPNDIAPQMEKVMYGLDVMQAQPSLLDLQFAELEYKLHCQCGKQVAENFGHFVNYVMTAGALMSFNPTKSECR